MWSYVQGTTRPATFIPIIGLFVGGTEGSSGQVILLFGPMVG